MGATNDAPPPGDCTLCSRNPADKYITGTLTCWERCVECGLTIVKASNIISGAMFDDFDSAVAEFHRREEELIRG